MDWCAGILEENYFNTMSMENPLPGYTMAAAATDVEMIGPPEEQKLA